MKQYVLIIYICLQVLMFCTSLYAEGKVIYKSKGDCADIATNVYYKAIQQGYIVRLVNGWDENNTPHRWVEWWNKDKWCLWDEAIWYVNGRSAYTPEQHGYKRHTILGSNNKLKNLYAYSRQNS